MTQDEIIRMARECGGIADDQTIVLYYEELERFASLVAANEREACANVCKKKFGKFSESKDDWLRGFANGAYDCEVAIRNRGAK